MRTFRLITGLTFVLFAAMTFAFAQNEKPQAVSANKIVVINTDAFKDERTGIQDFIEIYKRLEEEFKLQTEELRIMNENLQKLFNEFIEANDRCNKALHCSDKMSEDISKKLEGYKLFNEKFNNRVAEVKVLFEKRKAELTIDINKKIVDAINQFAKEKGYALVLDVSKLPSNTVTPNFDSSGDAMDITVEFIKYYNESFGKVKTR